MIKKGDIVVRKSYGKDIIFKVVKIIKSNNSQIAILKGVTIRIEADASVADLEIAQKQRIENNMRNLNTKLEGRIKNCDKIQKKYISVINKKFLKRNKEIIQTGKILHLDGDKRYSEKSEKYYKKMGLNAIVKNISERKQAIFVKTLLQKYTPDILVITGHDGMIKKGSGYNDIYNYRNSKYFINTVKEARKWERQQQNLVIFAGACQSFFEALMAAGANFASSPNRILIDFIDPLIVAEKIAVTEKSRYITIRDIENELRDGSAGIGGTGANGKKQIILFK